MMRSCIEPTSGRPSGWPRKARTIDRVILEHGPQARLSGLPPGAEPRAAATATAGPGGIADEVAALGRASTISPYLPMGASSFPTSRLSIWTRRPARYRERRGPDAALPRRTRRGKVRAGFTRFRASRRAVPAGARAGQPVRSRPRRGAASMTFAERVDRRRRIRLHRAAGALSGHGDAARGRLPRTPGTCAFARIEYGAAVCATSSGPGVARLRHAADVRARPRPPVSHSSQASLRGDRRAGQSIPAADDPGSSCRASDVAGCGHGRSATLTWLGTERDKVSHFTAAGVRRHDLPSLTFRSADEETVRYFPEKLPIGVGDDGRHARVSVPRHAERTDGLSTVPRAARRAASEPARLDDSSAGAAASDRRRGLPPAGLRRAPDPSACRPRSSMSCAGISRRVVMAASDLDDRYYRRADRLCRSPVSCAVPRVADGRRTRARRRHVTGPGRCSSRAARACLEMPGAAAPVPASPPLGWHGVSGWR